MILITKEAKDRILNDQVNDLQDFTEISSGVFGLHRKNIYPAGFDYDRMKMSYSLCKMNNKSLKMKRGEFLEVIKVLGKVIMDFLLDYEIIHLRGIGTIFFAGVERFTSKYTIRKCRKDNTQGLASLKCKLIPSWRMKYTVLHTRETNKRLIEFHRDGNSFPSYFVNKK